MKDNEISEDLASELARSLDSFKMNYIFFDAIWGDQIEYEWQKEDLQLFHKQSDSKKLPGVKGCFLSHYLLWKKCIKINQPILIFEHDAIVIKEIFDSILQNEFDVLNLDYASREIADYEAHLKEEKSTEILSWHREEGNGFWSKMNKSSIKGIHSYIVKPSGAKKLVHKARTVGTIPADIHINSRYVDLKYTKQSYARINPKYWNNEFKNSEKSFTRAV